MPSLPESLPVALYGKRIFSAVGRAPQGYRWLARPPGVPESAITLANSLVSSFQWLSTPYDVRHSPVVFWIPANQSGAAGVFVRFLDSGEDDGGRPHTVRAELVNLDDFLLAEHPTLPWTLLSSREALRIKGEEVAPRLVLPPIGDTAVLTKAFQGFAAAPLTRPLALAPDPVRFRANAPDGTIALSAKTHDLLDLVSAESAAPTRATLPSGTTSPEIPRMEPIPNQPQSRRTALLVSVLFNFLLILLIAFNYNNVNTLKTEISNLEYDQAEIKRNLDRQTENLKEAKEVLDEKLEEAKKLQAQKEEAERKIGELQSEIRSKANQIEQLQENVDEATKDHLNQFETFKDKFRNALDTLHDMNRIISREAPKGVSAIGELIDFYNTITHVNTDR